MNKQGCIPYPLQKLRIERYVPIPKTEPRTDQESFWERLFGKKQEEKLESKEEEKLESKQEYKLQFKTDVKIKELVTIAVAAACQPGNDNSNDDDNVPDKEKRDKIIAAIISGLLIGGGVALIFVSGGTGTILAQHMLLNAGISGLNYSVKENFKWSEWGYQMGKSAAVTLITFGTSYTTGRFVGIALRDSTLTDWNIKAIGCIAGALAGGVTKGFSYVVICEYEGVEVSRFQLVLESITGAITGAFSGYRGAKISTIDRTALTTRVGSATDNQGMRIRLETVENSDHKMAAVIKKVKTDTLTANDVKEILDASNGRLIGDHAGHANLHTAEPIYTDEVLVPIRDGVKTSSLFLGENQQARIIHKILTDPRYLEKLEELKKSSKQLIIMYENIQNEFMYLDGADLTPKTIDKVFLLLKVTGNGHLHIHTCYPMYVFS
jgi:hypothetical protein